MYSQTHKQETKVFDTGVVYQATAPDFFYLACLYHRASLSGDTPAQ